MGFQKGYVPWNKGLHPSKETLIKMKISRIGIRPSEETKRKLRNAKLGEKNPMYGRMPKGEQSPAWNKNAISFSTGRGRARRMYGNRPCEYCGKKSEVHHIDGNPLNNNPENIRNLCRRCHMIEDGRLKTVIRNLKQFRR